MAFDLAQRTAGAEPSGRFSIDQSTNQRTYVLFDGPQESLGEDAVPLPAATLNQNLAAILGTTRPGPATGAIGTTAGAGSLVRDLPLVDPEHPSLFADAVAVRARPDEGYDSDSIDGTGLAVPPQEPDYAGYAAREADVAFATRPYPVLPDSRMTATTLAFTDSNVSFTPRTLTYYPEWLRFTQRFVDVADTRVSAEIAAQMMLYDGGGANDISFKGVPDMIVPDGIVRHVWYAVPDRYLSSPNSYLISLRGRVNQHQFQGRAPGEMLYLGCKVLRTYAPLSFAPSAVAGPQLGSFAIYQLVDVELSFIVTRRCEQVVLGDGTFSPNPLAIPAGEIFSANFIPNGHNLLPHFQSRRFLYGYTRSADFAARRPYYLSYPLEVLWQDPDVAGVVV